MKIFIIALTLVGSTAFAGQSGTPANALERAIADCEIIIEQEYEDAAELYRAVSTALRPLKAVKKYKALASFIESGVIVIGNMHVDANLCENLKAAR